MNAVLLIAHGARDPRWALPFEDVARRIAAQSPATRVELAYLELMQPDLAQAGQRLADAQCTRVEVLPMFLGAGGHVRDDLPRLVERLRAAHPQVAWCLHAPIGEAERVVQAMAEVAIALAISPGTPPPDEIIAPASTPPDT